jgi:hypothetical protein
MTCYYDGEKGTSIISKSNAGVIPCGKGMEGFVHPKVGRQQFFLDNSRLVLIQVMNCVYNKENG